MKQVTNHVENQIVSDIHAIIEQSRLQVAATVNAGMTLMYWHIGERINREVLGGERAAYGKQIVASLANNLTEEYGRGYDAKSLRKMMKFASVFPDIQIVAPLVRQLSWSLSCKLSLSKMSSSVSSILRWQQIRGGQNAP
jgi:hypothetical protein